MSELSQAINGKLGAFVNKIIFLEKTNLVEYEGENFYPSEIHLILVVDRKPKNASQMAEMLQVTRGAVSQTISRLVRKGVLEKKRDPFNKNELTVTFTAKGERVLQLCQERVKGVDERFREHLDTYSQDEQETVNRFLTHVSRLFDEML